MVFFCGAGVSKPAGLPGFFDLTRRVLLKLGVSSSSPVGRLMSAALDADDPALAPPLDQVFDLLQREFTSSQVTENVARMLRTPRRPDVTRHQWIMDLSMSTAGKTLVVTTNFDRLFERAGRKLEVWRCPLPSAASP